MEARVLSALMTVAFCVGIITSHASASPIAVEGRLSVLVANSADPQHGSTYRHHLLADDGTLYILNLTGPPTLRSGTWVRVTGTVTATVRLPTRIISLAVASIDPVEQEGALAADVAPSGTGPKVLRVLFVLVTMCSQPNPLTIAQAQRVYFGTNSSSPTLQQWYSACSSGATNLATTSKVVEVSLPCSGYTAKGDVWAANVCEPRMGEYIFTDAVNEKLKQTMDLADFNSYQHKVYVLNKNHPCPVLHNYVGLGINGCKYDSMCISWIAAGYATSVMVYAHELGHNMMLAHAAWNGSDYSDWSCAMGNAYHYRCFNAPHQWQLGWSTERYSMLSSSNFPEGKTFGITLPAMDTATDNMLRIVADWMGDTKPPVYWLSYRRAGGYQGVDRLVDKYGYNWGDMVAVHRYDAAGPTDFAFQYITYLQTVDLDYSGTMWRDRTLVVRVYNVNTTAPGSAYITVCRQDGTTETPAQCFDGLDNDCDGLFDAADPDCRGAGRPASPATTPPRPPSPTTPDPPAPQPSPCSTTYIYTLTLTSNGTTSQAWPAAKAQLVAALKAVYKKRKLAYPGPTRFLDVDTKGVPLKRPTANKWKFRLKVNLGACRTAGRARVFLRALNTALKGASVSLSSG